MKQLVFNISDEAFEFLKLLNEKGSAEYRDREHETLEDFLKSDAHLVHGRTKEHFLARNFGGTYHLIGELVKHNLIDCENEAWHLTYEVTEVGKEILKLNS
ncbi:MAG: hypothetical protein AABY15_06650 [Nanoarchaeota archaeon]